MNKFEKFIGAPYDSRVEAEIILLHDGPPPIISLITPGSIVTADYRLDRYRVTVDDYDSKIIKSIRNG